MNPGELNCRVIIQKLVETRDAEGNLVASYVDKKNKWANIATITAKSVDGTVEKSVKTINRIKLRYDSGIIYTDRIKYGSRIFVQSAPPLNIGERNAFMQLECIELFEVAHA